MLSMSGSARPASMPAFVRPWALGHRTTRFCVALAILATLALSGCVRNAPRGVAQRYVDNLKKFNYAGCYAMLSDQDRAERTLAQFLTEIPLAPDADPIWFRPILIRTEFTVGDAHVDGEKATVPVSIAMPDLPRWERTLDAVAGPDRSGAELAGRSLDAGDFPVITVDDQIVMVKQHHHWRVVGAFAARDRAADLDREAVVAFHRHDYPTAIARYHAILSQIADTRATGALGLAARYQAELAQVQAVQSEAARATDYAAKQLVLSGVAMRMSEERVPAIFGTITNRGGRALDDVDLTVTWYAGRGKDLKAVYAEKHPIVATPYQFTDFSRPVIPFVPGESRPFGFILTAPVEVQQDANPYVTIGGVAFTQSIAPLPKLTVAAVAPPAPARASSVTPGASSAAATSAATPMGIAIPKGPSPQLAPPPNRPHS
jgi:outer membrane murein-binding lipoprotein Lpp